MLTRRGYLINATELHHLASASEQADVELYLHLVCRCRERCLVRSIGAKGGHFGALRGLIVDILQVIVNIDFSDLLGV